MRQNTVFLQTSESSDSSDDDSFDSDSDTSDSDHHEQEPVAGSSTAGKIFSI